MIETVLEQVDRCSSCGKVGLPPHSCPFQEEVWNDSSIKCTCCEGCIHECRMDI